MFRISHLFGNPDASSYQLSKYEQAVECLQTQRYDSALALAAEVYQAHPESKSAGLLYGSMLLETGKTQIGYHTLVSLAEKFPTDFYIQLQCGRFLQMLAYKSGDQSLSNTAQGYYARAVKVNRYKAAYARNLWDRTAQQMTKGSTPRGGSGN